MASLVVVGTQWGDEGKGKVVDCLARTAALVARYQGGPNAGHTVCRSGKEITLHQIPSGILTPGVRCVIGCGCVVDPYPFREELAALAGWKVRPGRRLVLDKRAHMILPYHKLLDRLHEEHSAKQRIGTTCRGIGPAYQDKFSRVGIRAGDLLDEETFNTRLRRNVAAANFLLMELYKAEPISFQKIAREYWEASRPLAKLVGDASTEIEKALRERKRVLFEGAQGTHLDIDLGTYPYVTASSTTVAGAAVGTGISPFWLDEAVGVAKAYTTRVGEGPFPTELDPEEAEYLRRLGHEFGATTGRPRRCGWFDAGLVRASVRHSRLSALVITKLDVLDSFDVISVGTGYTLDGTRLSEFDAFHAAKLEPRYVSLPGWREPTCGCRCYRDLPHAARRYLSKLEELVECPIAFVSVGSDREANVPVQPGKLRWLKSA
ncbi:MAG: adenylosuccinate synthase [candidate division WOR-3 bacterium]